MSNGHPAQTEWSLFIVHRLVSALRQMGFSLSQQRTVQGHVCVCVRVCVFSSELYVNGKPKDKKVQKNDLFVAGVTCQ